MTDRCGEGGGGQKNEPCCLEQWIAINDVKSRGLYGIQYVICHKEAESIERRVFVAFPPLGICSGTNI